jgi:hypothetical protein
MDFIAADGPALVKAAKGAGVEISKKKTAFLVQGDRVRDAASIQVRDIGFRSTAEVVMESTTGPPRSPCGVS